jgi:HPt (histidine-containing phosphotransfer) domain-containing protein
MGNLHRVTNTPYCLIEYEKLRTCKLFKISNYIEGNAIVSSSDVNIFDTQFAINQFSGNETLLVKILDKFIQQYQHFETLLTEHLQQQDLNAANQQIHTLKGVSGNLGMKALYQACKELEVNLANQETENASDDFLQVFKQTLSVIKNFSAEKGIQENPEAAHQQYDKVSLIASLTRNEFISESKIHSYGKSLGLSSEKLQEIKLAIDNLDYNSAIALLE